MDIQSLSQECDETIKRFEYQKNNFNYYVNSHWLEGFRKFLDTWSAEYVTKHTEYYAKNGKHEFDLRFIITNRHMGDIKVKPTIETDLTNPFSDYSLIYNIYNADREFARFIGHEHAIPFIEGVEEAYDYFINQIKMYGLTIVSADKFEMSEKEWHKMFKTWFKYTKIFTVKVSF